MEAYDAVVRVLKEADKPLTPQEITSTAQRNGYWKTDGITPDRTISAVITRDIKDNPESSRFIRIKPNLYDLRNSNIAETSNQSSSGTAANSRTTFIDAAHKVLSMKDGNQSLHYRSITEIALQAKYIVPTGRTPEATMSSALSRLVKQQSLRGDKPTFESLGKGYYRLTPPEKKSIIVEAENHNGVIKKKLKKKLLQLKFDEFEEFVGRFLSDIRFEDIEVTKKSSDRGIDVRGTLVIADVIKTKMAVQIKKWTNNVQAPTVQQLRGSLGAHEHGLIVTTSGFSKGALSEASRKDVTPIALMDGNQLIDLMFENEIGVKRKSVHLFEFDSNNL